MVARVAGRALVVDAGLEQQIERVSRMFAERMGRPYTEFATGVTKQATLPEGALSLGLAGTAPGLRARHRRLGRGRGAARSSARASAPVAARARDRARAAGAGARPGAWSSGPALLRHAGVRRRSGARRGGWRRGRGGGDDLRAGVRDPRRPGVRPGRARAGGGTRQPRCAARSSATSSARTGARSRRSSSSAAARAVSRSRLPSPAPAASWRRA